MDLGFPHTISRKVSLEFFSNKFSHNFQVIFSESIAGKFFGNFHSSPCQKEFLCYLLFYKGFTVHHKMGDLRKMIICKVICDFTSIHKRLNDRKISSIKKSCIDLGGILDVKRTYFFRSELKEKGELTPNNPKFHAIYSFPKKDISTIIELMEQLNCDVIPVYEKVG